jgi:hypothetical protein
MDKKDIGQVVVTAVLVTAIFTVLLLLGIPLIHTTN